MKVWRSSKYRCLIVQWLIYSEDRIRCVLIHSCIGGEFAADIYSIYYTHWHQSVRGAPMVHLHKQLGGGIVNFSNWNSWQASYIPDLSCVLLLYWKLQLPSTRIKSLLSCVLCLEESSAPMKNISSYFRIFSFTQNNPSQKKEMDEYFYQLDSQWSTGLSIISSGRFN